MSLLSKLAKSVKKRVLPAAIGFLTGGPAGAAAAVFGGSGGGGRTPPILPPPMSMGMLPALPAIGGAAARALPALIPRVLPGLGRAAGGAAGAVIRGGRALARSKWSRRAIAAAGYYQVGSLVYDAAGNLVGQVSRRRMNPLNHRALRRAISRVKSARKICRQVEKISGGPRRARAACPPKKCR